MEQNHNFRNSDTTLIAYLITVGYSVIGTEKDQDTLRVVFVLDIPKDSPKLIQLVGTFYAGQATVEPSAFSRNYRNLVNMLRQVGGNNG